MRKFTERDLILRLTGIAIFSSLGFVCARFLAFPYAGGAGYFNFGDVITILASLIMGPIEGMAVGMISGSLADFSSGYVLFIPFTIVAKGLMGLASGLLFNLLEKHKVVRYSGTLLGATLMVLTYMVSYWWYYGPASLINSAFDAVQGFGSAAIAISIAIPLIKSGVFRRIYNPVNTKSSQTN